MTEEGIDAFIFVDTVDHRDGYISNKHKNSSRSPDPSANSGHQ